MNITPGTPSRSPSRESERVALTADANTPPPVSQHDLRSVSLPSEGRHDVAAVTERAATTEHSASLAAKKDLENSSDSSSSGKDTKSLLRKLYTDVAVYTAAFTAPGVVGFLATDSLKSFVIPGILVAWTAVAAVLRRGQILRGDI